MIKRISLVIFALLLVALSAATAFATSYMDGPKVYDDGDLLTSGEQAELKQRLDAMSEQYKCDVVVATVETLGDMDVEEYSDYLYDTMDYGMFNDGKCIMLLVCMEYRDWALTPYGDASKYFPLSKQDDMIDNFLPYLSSEDFYSAFEAFADDCEYTFENYGKITVKPMWLGVAAVIGIIIAFIVVLIMKSQLKTVRFQPAANSYLKSGSLNVTQQRDIFLYSTVTRTPKPKNTSSGGGTGSAGPRSSGKF